ncbi:hypothetical protein PMAYCL1PPCAC_10387 [Pristionchus mayeri]|uniref:Uncharacterized protein n=1 Tax=Pristionchus mayeri TaxID=1317129 RepID=A0AAN4ZFB5_9BILA|nr:hypothetical protein PMAYCL1PPCAC_10387 [Pristionchus mayeri]
MLLDDEMDAVADVEKSIVDARVGCGKFVRSIDGHSRWFLRADYGTVPESLIHHDDSSGGQ